MALKAVLAEEIFKSFENSALLKVSFVISRTPLSVITTDPESGMITRRVPPVRPFSPFCEERTSSRIGEYFSTATDKTSSCAVVMFEAKFAIIFFLFSTDSDIFFSSIL